MKSNAERQAEFRGRQQAKDLEQKSQILDLFLEIKENCRRIEENLANLAQKQAEIDRFQAMNADFLTKTIFKFGKLHILWHKNPKE